MHRSFQNTNLHCLAAPSSIQPRCLAGQEGTGRQKQTKRNNKSPSRRCGSCMARGGGGTGWRRLGWGMEVRHGRPRQRWEDRRTASSRGSFTLQAVVPRRGVWGGPGPDKTLQAAGRAPRGTDRHTDGWKDGQEAAERAVMSMQSCWSQGQWPRPGERSSAGGEGGCLGGVHCRILIPEPDFRETIC